MKRIQLHPLSLLAGLPVGGLILVLMGMQQITNTRLIITGEQQEILSHMSIVYLADGQGGLAKTIRISDVNVQIVNGMGATNGYPADPTSNDPLLTATNGVGNLIVGYNESGNSFGDDRTGSHNVVVGSRNTHSSFGGLVAAVDNTISFAYASVSGGAGNRATAVYSSINGGLRNLASGDGSSVSGGRENTANDYWSWIGGGNLNTASGEYATISGGSGGIASGKHSSVNGGRACVASGIWSSAGGGYQCAATADSSSVSGGYECTADGFAASSTGGKWRSALSSYDWAGGSYYSDQ